ncbi:MAG: aldo/keto reductase [Magnetococcales bacterium]|nr:aldo/keto reductase [Magnetococcales bacterium]
MKRRDFIKTSVVAASAAALGGVEVPEAVAADKAVIRGFRPLGRTGFRMSDISFGAGKLPSASMVLRAIDAGINYFDTAPDYGPSEDYIGEALKRFRARDKIFIASKFCSHEPYPGHLPLGSAKDAYIAAVEASLKRLGTDHLDVVFVHAIGEKPDFEAERQRLLDDAMLAAFQQLKQDGKVRFLATSSHGPHNMEQLLLEAVNSGHFDLIMPAFNFMKFPKVPEVLKAAQAKGVGVVAMKTLAGAKDSGADLGGVFEHAAFKWVLKHPEVAGLVVTIRTTEELKLFVQASGEAFAASDQRILNRYAALHGADYCRTGCGDCESGCDQGIPVAAILRYRMYFKDYGDEKTAMRTYAMVRDNAALCADCGTAACSAGCSYGLDVRALLQDAHRHLSFQAPA